MLGEALTLGFVGDIVPSQSSFLDVEPDSDYAKVVAQLRDCDLLFGNCEIPLTNRGSRQQKPIAMRAPSSMNTGIASAGFALVSLANNHSFDYGETGLLDTIAHLQHVGVGHVGAGRNLEEARSARVLARNDCRVAFVAFSCLLPPGALAAADRAGISAVRVRTAYEVDPHDEMEEPGNAPIVRTWHRDDDLVPIVSEIERAKREADFVVVSVHWGFGNGNELAEYQRPLAHAVVAAGADVVIGHHVHAVQGVERHEGALIVYSPGNFVAQQPREGMRAATLAAFDAMSRDAFFGRIYLRKNERPELDVFPVVCDSRGLPRFATPHEFARIASDLQRCAAGRFQTLGDRLRLDPV